MFLMDDDKDFFEHLKNLFARTWSSGLCLAYFGRFTPACILFMSIDRPIGKSAADNTTPIEFEENHTCLAVKQAKPTSPTQGVRSNKHDILGLVFLANPCLAKGFQALSLTAAGAN